MQEISFEKLFKMFKTKVCHHFSKNLTCMTLTCMTENPNKENETLFIEIKSKLEQMNRYNTEGAILRSKCVWYQNGEKCSKYFLNLETTIKTSHMLGN